ncbi:MAG: DUF4340 domain-containing protein [Rhodanobacteraceae bacterium]
MTRQVRTNLILLLVAALLGCCVFAEVRREQGTREPPLTGLDLGAINTLDVQCPDCATRTFERVSGRWWMRTPYRLMADDTAIARLLAIAHAPVRSSRPASAFDPARVGLEPAGATLDIGGTRLSFGDTDAIDGNRYVREGDHIALIDDRFSPYLHATAESELDRHLLPPGEQLLELRVDDMARTQSAGAWRTVEARRIDKAKQNAPLAVGAVHAQLRLRDGSRIDYRFYRDGAQTLALRQTPPLIYTLDEAQVQALLGPRAAR